MRFLILALSLTAATAASAQTDQQLTAAHAAIDASEARLSDLDVRIRSGPTPADSGKAFAEKRIEWKTCAKAVTNYNALALTASDEQLARLALPKFASTIVCKG